MYQLHKHSAMVCHNITYIWSDTAFEMLRSKIESNLCQRTLTQPRSSKGQDNVQSTTIEVTEFERARIRKPYNAGKMREPSP